MTLYERIRHRREQLGISQGQLAEELGYTNRSTIAKIESGKNDITQSKIVAFAHALSTTPQYLMGWTDDPYDYDNDPNGVLASIPSNVRKELTKLHPDDPEAVWHAWEAMINDHDAGDTSTPTPPEYRYDNIFPITTKRVPFLGSIACGEPVFANEEHELYVEVGTNVHADFCLQAAGDSMIGARIHDGDIVFIRKQGMVDNGEIAAVIIEDEATLKRVNYYPDKNLLILHAENPSYKDLIYTDAELDQIVILGKAVAFQSDVR